jgi:hypothetical protein
LTLQATPALQPGQLPPQSAPVSLPFFTKSEQVGAWQRPFWQTELPQSVAPPQILPEPQSGQDPPQSTSLSFPFFTESAHDST